MSEKRGNGSVVAVFLGLLLAATLGLPGEAMAKWRAPDVTLNFGGQIFQQGQSNNFGPALRQILDDYWVPGECTYHGRVRPAESCDTLRFGLTMFADVDGGPTSCASGDAVNNPIEPPQEDGGGVIGDKVQEMQNLAGIEYCDQAGTGWAYRPDDEALRVHRENTFPEAYDDSTVDDSVLDRWWDRPNLVLSIVDSLPQRSDGDGRVKKALEQACYSYHGGTSPASHPAIPTWVLVAPRHDPGAPSYGGLLAGAGGTAACCYNQSGCTVTNDQSPDLIDVCTHIQGRSEAQLRHGIANGHYSCSSSEKLTVTGGLESNTLPNIQCHLAGVKCNASGSPDPPTNLFEIFACIQMRPRHIAPENLTVEYCHDDSLNCELLTEANGGLSFVDEHKSMYILNGTNPDGSSYCKGIANKEATIEVIECPREGEACDTGKDGRCAIGTFQCQQDGTEYCQQTFEPMPEICNGLDDDCDGTEDNFADSWSKSKFSSYSLDSEHSGLDCNLQDSCSCGGGQVDNHVGSNFSEYLAGWQGNCTCGLPLGADDSASIEGPNDGYDTEQASCSATPDGGEAGGLFGVIAAGLLGVALWRRRAESEDA